MPLWTIEGSPIAALSLLLDGRKHAGTTQAYYAGKGTLMWTVTTRQLDAGVVEVNATFMPDTGTPFSCSSIIKIGSEAEFVQSAKEQLLKHQDIHKDDDALRLSIETALNEDK